MNGTVMIQRINVQVFVFSKNPTFRALILKRTLKEVVIGSQYVVVQRIRRKW
jgi:hypothetical protein